MTTLSAGLGHSTAKNANGAVKEAVGAALSALEGKPPGLAFVTATVDYDADLVHRTLREELPGVPIHGVTTSLGVLGSKGVTTGAHGAVGVLLLGAAEGILFAVGGSELGDDPTAAGRRAAQAVARAVPNPAVLLFNGSPGAEEDVLEGVASVLPGVRAYGGSAADHAIAGEWRVFMNDAVASNALSLAAIGGDVRVGCAFVVPYEPLGEEATVTRSEGRRIATLSDRPAAEVLREWVGAGIDDQARHGGAILTQTALNPLGIRLSEASQEHFVTLHPAQIQAEGAVDLFARAGEGTTVCRMCTTEDALVIALSQVMDRALADGGLTAEQVKAAVLIYCAGCAGALGPRLHDGLKERLGGPWADVPLLGLCTFGEQGHVPGVGNVHANLSLGVVLFGDGPA